MHAHCVSIPVAGHGQSRLDCKGPTPWNLAPGTLSNSARGGLELAGRGWEALI